ncbi:hypothetical protein M407DRAFT_245458 [Tulasnella calospora MUT 4182]|uniref:Uncharacterized protein n=1 Tax=Tulasnella calospora MUT 4182 TaxID=1051891 RepID=A0A0C3LJ96_9AGAM|nr:hypothetical protein M407DRAFT_245458 [Tulasnella calospora MUT 4182]
MLVERSSLAHAKTTPPEHFVRTIAAMPASVSGPGMSPVASASQTASFETIGKSITITTWNRMLAR